MVTRRRARVGSKAQKMLSSGSANGSVNCQPADGQTAQGQLLVAPPVPGERLRDRRIFGGEFDVAEEARLLAGYRAILVASLRAVCGWIPQIAEHEVKLACGRHVYDDARHADALTRRMAELRLPLDDAPPVPEPLRRLLDELVYAEDTPSFLAGVYRVLKPALLAAINHHLAVCDPVADVPTRLVLEPLVASLQEHCSWGQLAVEELGRQAASRKSILWEAHLQTLLADAGGSLTEAIRLRGREADAVDGPDPGGNGTAGLVETAARAPFRPADEARRDSRFTIEGIAGNTETDRKTKEEMMVNEEAGPPRGGPQRKDHVTWARENLHRIANEVQAVETCARLIWDGETCGMPWQFTVDIARQLWDEVRHVEISQKRLEQLGGYLGMYPVMTANYNFRCQLPIELRIADLMLSGETHGLNNQMHMRERCRKAGDIQTQRLHDYMQADEVQHVQFGRRWAVYLAKQQLGQDASDAEVRALLRQWVQEAKQARIAYTKTGNAFANEGESALAGSDRPEKKQEAARPVDVRTLRLAGLSEEEIQEMVQKAGGAVLDPAELR